MKLLPEEVAPNILYQYLVGAVAPRPICFASTIDEQGNANLSPYSFFNIFGANPTTLIFSPLRRMRNNTIKHTLENVLATKEVVINVVNYAMVQQASLSSCEYADGVDEFIKAGFTKLASDVVKPFRVAESPVQIECKVREVIATGEAGGAGNLVICEVVAMHVNDDVLDDKQQIDPHKIDLVARMGQNFYCRASGAAIFEVEKPNTKLGIGFNGLPTSLLQSPILTGNHLGMLANVNELPICDAAFKHMEATQIVQYYNLNPTEMGQELHKLAAKLLDNNEVDKAWQVLLLDLD